MCHLCDKYICSSSESYRGRILIYFLAFRPSVRHSLSCCSSWTYWHDFWHADAAPYVLHIFLLVRGTILIYFLAFCPSVCRSQPFLLQPLDLLTWFLAWWCGSIWIAYISVSMSTPLTMTGPHGQLASFILHGWQRFIFLFAEFYFETFIIYSKGLCHIIAIGKIYETD